MQINFHGLYSSVRRLVSSPLEGTQNAQGQQKNIADLERTNSPKASEFNSLIDSQLQASGTDPEVRGRLSTIPPELKLERPDLKTIELPEIVKEPTEPVKKPKLLSATRLSAQETAGASPALDPPKQSLVEAILNPKARQLGVDPSLGMAVVKAESSFRIGAVSKDGHESKGLFQLLDSTAKTVIDREGLSSEYDPFKPETNVEIGVHYLRYLHDIFSTDTALPNKYSTVAAANSSSLEKLAVAAFNAGEGRVAAAQQQAKEAGSDPTDFDQIRAYLPKSTQEYVNRVMAFRAEFSDEGALS